VVEVGDERGDGPLEVDIVLPKGVVCVEEESLGEEPGSVLSSHRISIEGLCERLKAKGGW
jgi:hypothetical protein